MLVELELKTPTVPAQHFPIYRLEAELLKHPQIECLVEHHHCDGLYARSMHIPAGTVATGAVHKSESFFVVRRGRLVLSTEDGPVTLEAGDQSVTQVGTKRAVFALTDVVLTTYHPNPTNERDPQRLWDLFVVPAPSTLLEVA